MTESHEACEAAIEAKYVNFPLLSPGPLEYTRGDIRAAFRSGWYARGAYEDAEWQSFWEDNEVSGLPLSPGSGTGEGDA